MRLDLEAGTGRGSLNHAREAGRGERFPPRLKLLANAVQYHLNRRGIVAGLSILDTLPLTATHP
jgi:hypothetical protein